MTAKRPSLGVYLTAWAVIHLWSIASGFQLVPYPNGEFLFSDVRLYDWWAVNMSLGTFPVGDDAWQYPPLAAIVFLAGWHIAGDTVGFVLLGLIADVALTVALFFAGRHAARPTELPVQLWLAAPLLVGPIAQGRFDVFPTAVAVAGLLSVSVTSRGAWWAVGAWLKVWPGLGLLAVPRAALARTTAGFAVTAIAIYLPLHHWWPSGMSFVYAQNARGLQIEAVAALPYSWWNLGPGSVTTGYQFGAIEILASGVSHIATGLTIASLSVVVTLVVLRLCGRLESASSADVLLTAVLTLMCTSKVLSPQYNLWIVGLMAACAIQPHPTFPTVVRLLAMSTVCGHLLYPWLYIPFQQGAALAVMVHTVRIVTLVSATILMWRSVLNARPTHRASPAL